MPRGAYTAKQDRKADHIAEGYREARRLEEGSRRARLARPVNKQDKGGKNDGSGRSRQPERRRQEGLGNRRRARQRLRR